MQKTNLHRLRRHFEAVDPLSEHIRGRNDDEGLDRYALELARVLPNEEGAVVVELGCADGAVTARIASQHPDLRFIGADISLSLLRLARARGLMAVQMGSPFFPFLQDTVDLVVSFSVLQYFDTKTYRCMMLELARVLAPGGRVAHLGVPDLAHFWRHSDFPRSMLCRRPWWAISARVARRYGPPSLLSSWWSAPLLKRHTPEAFDLQITPSLESDHRLDMVATKMASQQ
jgi:SAM-dependent methyltransferase